MKLLKSIFSVWLIATVVACSNKIEYGPDPYAGGLEDLGISFEDASPSPTRARVGATVLFQVDGLLKYKDELKFYVNNIEAEVTTLTDSTLTVIVPDHASSGSVRVVVQGQVFAGPYLPIIGKLGIDATFQPGIGTNGSITTIKQLSSANGNKIFIAGEFTDYNGTSASTKINGIAAITNSGELDRTVNFGEGLENGNVNSIVEVGAGNIILAGNFASYNKINNIKNITRINAGGALSTQVVDILNLTDDPAYSTLTVPTFNGGTESTILSVFYQNNKLYAIGGFKAYTDNYYERSTYDNILSDFFPMGNVVRMNVDGSLDSTYYIKKEGVKSVGLAGVNGVVNGGHLQSDGKLVMIGSFTRFNNANEVGRILRLSTTGDIDATFQSGTGANGSIFRINYSAALDKYVIVGNFTKYNGQDARNIAVLNSDGSLDTSFQSLGFAGGTPSFAYQMSNGLIVVTGTFGSYGGIVREGLLVLDRDGRLSADYNNSGKFTGYAYDALEGVNSLNQKTLTLVGYISAFNGTNSIGNIVRLAFQN